MTRAVFLTGMMGSGKSTVGRLLAEKRGATFVDLDTRIERLFGGDIGLQFAAGEPQFRRRERAALDSLCAEPAFADRDVVVATGGGAVVDPHNRETMVRHGAVLFLDVPVDELCRRLEPSTQTNKRPLVVGAPAGQRRRLAELFEARRSAYLDRCMVIDGRGTAEAVVARLERMLETPSRRDIEAV